MLHGHGSFSTPGSPCTPAPEGDGTEYSQEINPEIQLHSDLGQSCNSLYREEFGKSWFCGQHHIVILKAYGLEIDRIPDGAAVSSVTKAEWISQPTSADPSGIWIAALAFPPESIFPV